MRDCTELTWQPRRSHGVCDYVTTGCSSVDCLGGSGSLFCSCLLCEGLCKELKKFYFIVRMVVGDSPLLQWFLESHHHPVRNGRWHVFAGRLDQLGTDGPKHGVEGEPTSQADHWPGGAGHSGWRWCKEEPSPCSLVLGRLVVFIVGWYDKV